MYDHYKPLRNFLRKFNLWSGLGACYYYMQYLQFDQKLPDQLASDATQRGWSRMKTGLFEHNIEVLIRELLLNSPFKGGASLNTGKDVRAAMQKIHNIDGKAWSGHEARQDDIILHLSRLAHQQFPWQKPLGNAMLARYRSLYSYPEVATILESEFGLDVDEFFQVILLFLEELMRSPTLSLEFLQTVEKTAREPVLAISSRLSRSVSELRNLAQVRQSYDVNWAYTLNPVREFPLIHAGNPDSLMCPAPPILIQRMTDGLYFDLIRADKSFGGAIGAAFEAYVGVTIANIAGDAVTILGEECWGKPEKRTVDWLVEDNTATLFIECKLARLDLASQTVISSNPPLDAALERLADNIGQAYASLSDALAGNYPHWKFRKLPVHLVVVTFYEWFAFGPYFYSKLDELVENNFRDRALPHDLLKNYPFTLASVEDFEALLFAIVDNDIQSVMGAKETERHRQSLMRGFLIDQFPGCVQQAAVVLEDAMKDLTIKPSRITQL